MNPTRYGRQTDAPQEPQQFRIALCAIVQSVRKLLKLHPVCPEEQRILICCYSVECDDKVLAHILKPTSEEEVLQEANDLGH